MTVYSFGWQELALRIRDGSIATDLSRPLDPQRYWLAFDLGRAPVPPDLPRRSAVRGRRARLQPPLPVAARPGSRSSSASRSPSSSASASASSTTPRRSGCRHPRRRHGLAITCRSSSRAWRSCRSRSSRTGCARSRTRCRSPRSCRRRSTSGSASTTGAALVARPRAPGVLGGRCCSGSAGWRCAPAHGSWWSRVAETRRSSGGASSARRSARSCSTASSFVLDAAGAFLISFIDFLAVLVIFHNVAALGGWTRARGRVPLRAVGDLVRDRPTCSSATSTMFPQKIRDGNFDILLAPPARHAVPGDRVRLPAAPARQGAPGRGRARLRARRRSTSHWTLGRVAMLVVIDPVGGRDLRRRSGSLGTCLAFWTTDGGEFTNAFTYGGNVPRAVPARHLRPVAAPLPRVHRPARVRHLLPGALPARQARSARACRPRSQFARPLVALASAFDRRRSRGASPSATTGARADDPASSGSRKQLRRAPAGACGASASVVEAVRGHLVHRRARARWSATSARTARASRRRSRC